MRHLFLLIVLIATIVVTASGALAQPPGPPPGAMSAPGYGPPPGPRAMPSVTPASFAYSEGGGIQASVPGAHHPLVTRPLPPGVAVSRIHDLGTTVGQVTHLSSSGSIAKVHAAGGSTAWMAPAPGYLIPGQVVVLRYNVVLTNGDLIPMGVMQCPGKPPVAVIDPPIDRIKWRK